MQGIYSLTAFTENMPCRDGFLCKRQRNNTCRFLHTELQKAYVEKSKFLYRNFIANPELKRILGTVARTRGDKLVFIPLNKEITQLYPDLEFIIMKQTQAILSDQHYYEALCLDLQSEDGGFFVRLIEEERAWGKIGNEKDDVKALFYGQKAIYQEEHEFKGRFKIGIIRERFDGKVTVKCSESGMDYFVFNDKYQNRALVGSEVHFLEIEEQNKKKAQVVSVLKCPYERKEIYGILTSPNFKDQLDVRYIDCSLPKTVDWDALDMIFSKAKKEFSLSLSASITKEDFIKKHCKSLNLDPEDKHLKYLAELIFNTPIEENKENKENTKEKISVKRAWVALFDMLYQRREIMKDKSCYFKPLNKGLPTFECLYIQEALKENPEVWRSYVKVRYLGWPSSSTHPLVRIQSSEGIIGDLEADARAILGKNNIKISEFSAEVRNEEQEILKSWQQKLDESIERSDEKVFSIDGLQTVIRDDAFSIQKIKTGKYEGCYQVGIHIADVSRILKKNSEIYKDAKYRSQTCYAGDFYKPMLPETLQKQLSLMQGQWSYAFSIYITMNQEGVINPGEIRLKHTLIKTAANFNYKEVDEQFANPEKEIIKCEDEVKKSLFLLRDLVLKVTERRDKLGYKVDIREEDEEDCADSQSHLLVEELMLLANKIVTDYAENQKTLLGEKLIKVRNSEKRLAREKKEDGEISEDEVEVQSKRRISGDEDASELDSGSSKVEEKAAIDGCSYLKKLWEKIDQDKNLDLTDQKSYSESVKNMLNDPDIKDSIKWYVKYSLRLNQPKIKFYIRNKLESREHEKTIKSIVPSEDRKEEEKFDQNGENEFSVAYSEGIITKYNKLKESQKMKFTSPIRRFQDVLIHYLISDILELEGEISRINSIIKEKLSEQETKSRYQIFKELDNQLKKRIEGISIAQNELRAHYEEYCNPREKDMSRSKREIEIMETCKSIISTGKPKITDAIIVKINKTGGIKVFLLEFSFECILSDKYSVVEEEVWARIQDQGVEVYCYEDIKVQIDVKKTVPLDFDVKFHSQVSSTNI